VQLLPVSVVNDSLHVYHSLHPVTQDYNIKVQWERKGCQADQQVGCSSIFFNGCLYVYYYHGPVALIGVPVSVPSLFFARLVCVLYS
jgi:hypothetical protein